MKPFILGTPRRVDAAFRSTGELYRIVGHNCGNLAFMHAVDAHLGGDLPTVRWSDPIDAINGRGDVAVLPAANQLSARFDFGKAVARLKETTAPLVVIGLGAQSDIGWTHPKLSERTVDWLRWLATRAPTAAPHIGVRGAFSLAVLGELGVGGHAAVVGCPSHFINPSPTLGVDIASRLRPPQRVAVVAGHQGWRHLRRLEASLGELVTRTNGSYIGQAAFDMMKLARGQARSMDETTLRQCRDYVRPDMALSSFIDWSIRHGDIFFDVQNWLEHYRRFDFVIGTRIHGTILGLQAGVPSVCIAHDSRTLELCQTLKVPYVLAHDVKNGIELDDLISCFKFDADAFDRNRRALCRAYVAFLKSNRLRPAKWLVELGQYSEAAALPAEAPPRTEAQPPIEAEAAL